MHHLLSTIQASRLQLLPELSDLLLKAASSVDTVHVQTLTIGHTALCKPYIEQNYSTAPVYIQVLQHYSIV